MSSIFSLLTPESLRLTLLYPCSLSHSRCLELLFQATPKGEEQGELHLVFLCGGGGFLSMCPSPPRDLRERDSKQKRYGIEVLGKVWLETNVLTFGEVPRACFQL